MSQRKKYKVLENNLKHRYENKTYYILMYNTMVNTNFEKNKIYNTMINTNFEKKKIK